MPLYKQPTPQQIIAIRKNWARLSSFGWLRFVLLAGTAMFAFMVVCWVGFCFCFGNERVLRLPFVWEASLPCMAFLSYFAMTVYYGVMRTWIRRVGTAG